MGPAYGWTALGAGALVALFTLATQIGFGAGDFAAVAGTGLLVSAGAAAVGFASSGVDRRRALGGALLGLVPVALLAWYLATSNG